MLLYDGKEEWRTRTEVGTGDIKVAECVISKFENTECGDGWGKKKNASGVKAGGQN